MFTRNSDFRSPKKIEKIVSCFQLLFPNYLELGLFYHQGKRKPTDRLKVNDVYYAKDVFKDRVTSERKSVTISLVCLETNDFLSSCNDSKLSY